MIAGLILAGNARADARQAKAAPAATGFAVAWEWGLGSPGKVSMATGVSRVFIADTETGVVAHTAADGLLAWTQKFPSTLAPVVAGDQVFIASSARVHALDEASGRPRWARDMGGVATAIAANGAGVLGAAGRILRAWSADGIPAWERAFEGEVAPGLLAVDAGLAYVGLLNGALVGVDVATGDVRWQKKLPTVPRAFAAAGGLLYFGGADRHLYAYKRGGGRAWRFERVDVIGAPATDDRLVYAVLWDNTAQAFDRNNGIRKWRTALPTRALSGPWSAGTEIAVPLRSGAIAILDRKTGVLQPAPKPGSADRPGDQVLAIAASASGNEVFGVILLENNSRLLVARRRIK